MSNDVIKAVKIAEAELRGIQHSAVTLRLECRDGRLNRIEVTRVKSILVRDLNTTETEAYYGNKERN